ncbi:MAG: UvrABC system protein A [Candidatus Omnitrophica bacterium ADurb.Bin292]|nr:MAG: UvrABC system protein A [Candidatus Omnitrophica bacterium ADurb.Bin292]
MGAIELRGVKTHNLKNLQLKLPRRKLYVVTGVSGSGKSSLAFDTLYAEGQRRYLESVSAYARQFLERMPKPDVEFSSGIPPALAIQTKNVVSNARSTVGTQTEINDYLRVAFARAGRLICPECEIEVEKYDPVSIARRLLQDFLEKTVRIVALVPLGKAGMKYLSENVRELERQGFSDFFCDGEWKNGDSLLSAKQKFSELRVSIDVLPVNEKNRERLTDSLELGFRYGKGNVQVWCQGRELKFSEILQCVSCGKKFPEPVANLFSFNSPLGACPACQGFGRVITIDRDLVVPDASKSIREGAIEPWTKASTRWERGQLLDFCARKRIPVQRPWATLKKEHQKWIFEGFPGDDYFSLRDFFDYLNKKIYKMHVRIFLNRYRGYVPCAVCHASRLKPDAMNYRLGGRTIADVQALPIDRLLEFLETIHLSPEEKEKMGPVHEELIRRVRFLKEVGLGYLTLDRMSRTLSGGEVQRIHLASSLGSALVDTLYVLDEPSIGLHERDNQMLIALLKKLRDLGNTVVVVEHDRTMIQSADEVIDLGPEGGAKGGRLVFQGSIDALKSCQASYTSRYLSGKEKLQRVFRPARGKPRKILIEGASAHNLKKIRAEIPLGRLAVLTGVSGSGKSTLLYNVLYNHYLKSKGQPVSRDELGNVKRIAGFDGVEDMVLVDQSSLGRSPRSNPATYTKAFEEVRKVFASTRQAKRAGFDAGYFSFNSEKGRCPVCKGDGAVKVEMHFLADIFVPCEACQGRRFKNEVLEIEYQGLNIDKVLQLTIDESVDFFQARKAIVDKLEPLRKIGLGYLKLGQPTLTLSGGEAQRLKLACEMAEPFSGAALYLLDEPTTGLHERDIHHLLTAFDELLARGHSLFVIEHHMGLIALADYVIDLGPEGGEEGGEIIYQGDMAGLLECNRSHTGRCLKKYLAGLSAAD